MRLPLLAIAWQTLFASCRCEAFLVHRQQRPYDLCRVAISTRRQPISNRRETHEPLRSSRLKESDSTDDGTTGNKDHKSSAPQLICVGEVLYDCIATDAARGWSLDQVVVKNEWTAFPGGANANVAAAYSKLSSSSGRGKNAAADNVAFVGCVGADDDGRALVTELREAGVDVGLMQTCPVYPTRRILVTRSVTGDRSFGGFWGNRKAHEFADAYLQEADLILAADSVLQSARWMVCGTLSLAFPVSAKAVEALLRRGLDHGVRLFVDVNWRPVFWNDANYSEDEIRRIILDFIGRHNAHAVKLTDEEAEWLLNIPAGEALENPGRVHAAFPHADAVLLTAGEKGASYSVSAQQLGCCVTGFVEPCSVSVVETTGAGDAFSAGFLYQWMEQEQVMNAAEPLEQRARRIDQMVRFASAVGALTCTKEGAIAAQPTLEEVEAYLHATS